MEKQNVIIIGGGPAGLAAGLYLGRSDLSPLIFAGSPPGGQLMNTTEVENFPGAPGVQGPQLVETIRAQASSFGAQIKDTNITRITNDGAINVFYNDAHGEVKVETKSLLIATGAKALWLGLPNEEKLKGRGVSACATCDGFFFRNKTVAVVGGGDTAIEEAMHLTKFATKVYIIHRRAEFKASPIMATRAKSNPKIEIIWNSRIKALNGDPKLTSVQLENLVDQSTSDLEVQGLFVAIGHKPDTELFKGLLALDKAGYIYTASSYSFAKFSDETTIETHFSHISPSSTTATGVFAAGDCVDTFYRQAATASGMGVAAALDIERYLSH